MRATAKGFLTIAGLLAMSVPMGLRAQQDSAVSDKDAKVVDFEELKYPQIARVAHIEGVVVIKAKLDDQGAVTDASAISGPNLLVRDCLTNAKKWRFQPNARKTAVLVYDFRMPGVLCKSASSFFMFRAPNVASIIGCTETVQTAR